MTLVGIHSDDDGNQIALIFNRMHSLRTLAILPALDILNVCVDAGVTIPAFVISDDDNNQISLNLDQILLQVHIRVGIKESAGKIYD